MSDASTEGKLKFCCRCYKRKPFDEFHKLYSSKDGLQLRCKPCQAEATLISRYGITRDEYMALYLKQNGCCAICEMPYPALTKDGLHVDHKHGNRNVRYVRGLLCGNCNRGLGVFQESIDLLDKASRYLAGQMDFLNIEGELNGHHPFRT